MLKDVSPFSRYQPPLLRLAIVSFGLSCVCFPLLLMTQYQIRRRNDIEEDNDCEVTCLVLTTAKRPWKINHTYTNWGWRCKHFIILSNYFHTDFGNVDVRNIEYLKNTPFDDYAHLTYKVYDGFLLAKIKYINDSKWFLKTDDDTFIHFDNLCKFLNRNNHNEPTWYGYGLSSGGTWYFSGGGGYVMSREALRKAQFYNGSYPSCMPAARSEDVMMGACLYASGIKMGISLDEKGREKFHAIEFRRNFLHIPGWLQSMALNFPRSGRGCCSRDTISFHYVKPEVMHMYEELIDELNLMDQ